MDEWLLHAAHTQSVFDHYVRSVCVCEGVKEREEGGKEERQGRESERESRYIYLLKSLSN